MHNTLMWEDINKEVEEFKETHIFPTIINTEIESESMVIYFFIKVIKYYLRVSDL